MKNARMSLTLDDDMKDVFDVQKGLAKNSTYANYIMRTYFEERGLLPAKVRD